MISYFLLALWTVITLLFFLWVLSNSLKIYHDFFTNPLGMPKKLDFPGYIKVWTADHRGEVTLSITAEFIVHVDNIIGALST